MTTVARFDQEGLNGSLKCAEMVQPLPGMHAVDPD